MRVLVTIAVGLGWALMACGAPPSAEMGHENGSETGKAIDEGSFVNVGGRVPPIAVYPVCSDETTGAVVTRTDGVCPSVAVSSGALIGTEGQSLLAIWGRYSRSAQVQANYRARLAMNPSITSDMISGAQFFCVYDYEGASTTATAYDFTADLRASGASIAGPECESPTPAPGEHGCPTCGGPHMLPPP